MGEVLQADGPGGLLGMALDPGLLKGSGNDFVYVAHTYDADPDPQIVRARTKIVRLTYDRERFTLGSPTDILTNLPAGTDHQGGRLVFGPDRKLYFTIGDLGANQLANFCKPDHSQNVPTAAQVQARDWSLYEGKVLRVNLDGSIPSDNPTIAGTKSHVYSYGHRNPQGLAFAPDRELYYQCWPTVAPSSLTVYPAVNGIPGWAHSLLMPSLKHGTVYRIQLNAAGTAVVGEPDENEHVKTVNRYRDVVVRPDGLALFIATDVGGNTQDETGRPASSVQNPGAILEFRYTGGARSAR